MLGSLCWFFSIYDRVFLRESFISYVLWFFGMKNSCGTNEVSLA